MRRRPRQISLKECYDILKLKKDADTADLKRAYRRRAFELHPDLNPGNPDASREFQLLNEAYVALSAILKHEDGVRASTEASRAAQAESKARAAKEEPADDRAEQKAQAENGSQGSNGQQAEPDAKEASSGPADAAAGARTADETGKAQKEQNQEQQKDKTADKKNAQNGYSEHDVLRDLLTDPFARRVFEDIYSELNRQHQEEAPPPAGSALPKGRAHFWPAQGKTHGRKAQCKTAQEQSGLGHAQVEQRPQQGRYRHGQGLAAPSD